MTLEELLESLDIELEYADPNKMKLEVFIIQDDEDKLPLMNASYDYVAKEVVLEV